MQVRIVYRNYKPLHDLYSSFMIRPPEGITYVIPSPKQSLRIFYPIYQKYGDNFLIRFFLRQAQKWFFEEPERDDKHTDILHFTQLLPSKPLANPYVVDFEHAISLADFVKVDDTILENIRDTLRHPNCAKIMPLSFAADRSLKELLNRRYSTIEKKIEIVYPALPNYHSLFGNDIDYSHVVSGHRTFKLLFVGNDAYRKGLHELLMAFENLERKYNNMKLYVISKIPESLRGKHTSDNIEFFEPNFSTHAIVRKFYLPCDLFVLPTHDDTFGMALLHALSCGTPVLTTRQFASPELIRPRYNGLFIQSQRLHLEDISLPSRTTSSRYHSGKVEETLVNDLKCKIEYLYHNRDLLVQMSQHAVTDFEPGGKFSINIRNHKLQQIYHGCMNN